VSPQQAADLMASTPLAWIDLQGFVNENQKKLEFKNHRFMIDIYADNSPDIVCIKSAQVGFSVYAILKSFHELKYEKRNILYALPTKNIVQDFVKPKVDPLIYSNKPIQDSMGNDSLSQKKFGDRFIYFKGGSEREAISVSADTLVIDEYDRMPDMNVVTMFDSRLQAAEEPRRRRFSNPSAIGFGVDALYKDSCRYVWMVTCSSCGYMSYMDFTREDYNYRGNQLFSHYVDKERAVYACGDCGAEIDNEDRRMGEWFAMHPENKRHGYWISQMMAPWVTAERIIDQEKEMDIATFHAFVLGKAWTPSDMVVNRETILAATAPSNVVKTQVAMGVDQDAGGQYYTLMTSAGIFEHGYVDSWEKIEHIKLMYNAVVVCDPNPYQAMPKQLAAKYDDFYLCYFKNLDGLSAVQWKEQEQVVYADRTRVIDIRANEIVHGRLLYREHAHKLEDVIAHWNNLYRTTEEKDDGKVKSIWIKKDGRQSDYPFAEVYARIGLSQLLGGEGMIIEPTREPEAKVTNISTTDGNTLTVDFSGILQDTMADME
jgi:hypothetical protein